MSDPAYKDLFELYYAAWNQLEEAMIEAGREAKMRPEEAAEWLRKRLAYIQKLEAVAEAAQELLEVGDIRGDTLLPAPPDDPKLHSARMQTAWDELRMALAELEGDKDE